MDKNTTTGEKQKIRVFNTKSDKVTNDGKIEQTDKYYLMIGDIEQNVIINIGQNNYEKIKELLTIKTK